jgi:hypothetical protein
MHEQACCAYFQMNSGRSAYLLMLVFSSAIGALPGYVNINKTRVRGEKVAGVKCVKSTTNRLLVFTRAGSANALKCP